MNYFFGYSIISFFQNAPMQFFSIIAQLSLLYNPLQIQDETKKDFYEKFVNTTVIYLRSEGIGTTYSDMIFEEETGIITIKNFTLRIPSMSKSRLSFYDCDENDFNSYEKNKFSMWGSCFIDIKLDELVLKLDGFNTKFAVNNGKIDFTNFPINQALNSDFYNIFFKEREIIVNFNLQTDYIFTKDALNLSLLIDISEIGKLEIDFTQNDLEFIRSFWKFDPSNSYMYTEISDTYISNLEVSYIDSGFVKNLKILLDYFGQYEDFNSDIKKIGNTISNEYDAEINKEYPNIKQNWENIIFFLEFPNQITCSRKNEHVINSQLLNAPPHFFIAGFCENIISN